MLILERVPSIQIHPYCILLLLLIIILTPAVPFPFNWFPQSWVIVSSRTLTSLIIIPFSWLVQKVNKYFLSEGLTNSELVKSACHKLIVRSARLGNQPCLLLGNVFTLTQQQIDICPSIFSPWPGMDAKPERDSKSHSSGFPLEVYKAQASRSRAVS